MISIDKYRAKHKRKGESDYRCDESDICDKCNNCKAKKCDEGSCKFAKRLEKLMKEQGFTNETLSEKSDLSENIISLYRNKGSSPNLDTLRRLAKVFEVSLDYLAGLENAKTISITELLNLDIIEKKTGLKLAIQAYQNSFGGVTKLHCTQYLPLGQLKIYPRNVGGDAIATLCGINHEVKDTYLVINGNIYRESSLISLADTIPEHEYTRFDMSIYDYVNEGNSLEPYIKAYENERYGLGLIGKLDPDDFFMLNYTFGFYQSHAQEN